MINIFTFQNLVEAMDLNALRAFALELLRPQPAAFADLVNGELPGASLEPDPEKPDPENPEWCKCGCCVAMPTQLENKCCTQTRRPCITLTPLFPQLVLDGNVLDLAMRYRKNFLVLNNVRNNENFRMLLTENMYSGNIEGWEGGTGAWFQAVVLQQYADDILLQMGYTLGINRLIVNICCTCFYYVVDH